MSRLKPCPFCGSERLNYGQRLDKDTSLYVRFVECDECTCSIKVYNSTVDIIEKWNTRKPMDKVVEQLEKLSTIHYSRFDDYMKQGNKELAKKHLLTFNAYHRAIDLVKAGGIDK